MKIIQIIHKIQNRGAETFACQLSNHLLEIGHQVKIISLYGGIGKLPFQGQIISLSASPAKILDIKSLKKLSGLIKNFEPDLIQVNSGDTLKFTVFSKFLFQWDFPIISRNASEVGQYLRSRSHVYINGLLYKKIDKVISVSRASEKDILNIYPFLQGKTEVIPVGLEQIPVIPIIELLPSNKKHIIHVGGFSFEKNHPGLLRIFKKVLRSEPNVHLHLIGDGDLKSLIENAVKDENLNDKVTFYGFINNPLTYIKSGDVLVLPSIIEGLPGVLLEAMYSKTPVIAYNVGGISEIVTPNTGFLINKNDEESFGDTILKILQHSEDEKVENAYKMVLNKYMNRQIAEKFVKAYHNLLN